MFGTRTFGYPKCASPLKSHACRCVTMASRTMKVLHSTVNDCSGKCPGDQLATVRPSTAEPCLVRQRPKVKWFREVASFRVVTSVEITKTQYCQLRNSTQPSNGPTFEISDLAYRIHKFLDSKFIQLWMFERSLLVGHGQLSEAL